MKHLLLLLAILLTINLSAQEKVQNFQPVSYVYPDLREKTKREIDRQSLLLEKEELTEAENTELEDLLEKYGEVVSSVWDVIDDGCSWYCGGGNYKVNASSNLKPQGKNTYDAKSANDLSYKTAWVEGKEDAGIGEYIEYHFEPKSPRITAIIIANGYMKSDIAWKNNNRVQSLKFYLNGEFYGILNLTDTKSDQRFELGTFGHNEDGSDLVLRFEINEIYQGDKYNDTAISEIYFDGIDVH
jgi:hypothetical protein